MKIHITSQQLNKLSGKAKKRLKEWLESRGLSYDKDSITIGQMIGFLDEHAKLNWWIRLHKPRYDVIYNDYVGCPDFEDYTELCDALWDVVVEVLEEIDKDEEEEK